MVQEVKSIIDWTNKLEDLVFNRKVNFVSLFYQFMVAQEVSSHKKVRYDESDWEDRKTESFMEDMAAS